jgi:hypothetical protein
LKNRSIAKDAFPQGHFVNAIGSRLEEKRSEEKGRKRKNTMGNLTPGRE